MRQPVSFQLATRGASGDACRDAVADTRSRSKVVSSSPAHRCYFGPLHYEPGYAYPVFVWLHGAGADEHQLQRVMPLLSTRNYVGVGLRGNVRLQGGAGYEWSSADRQLNGVEELILETLAAVQRRYHVNSSRVFLAGFRSGGATALQVGLRHPGQFAGVISLGGDCLIERMPPLRSDTMRGFSVFAARPQTPQDQICQVDRLMHAAGIDFTTCECAKPVSITRPLLRNVNTWIMARAARHLVR